MPETSYVLPSLDGRCRSMPEAELLAYVVFAGLPGPGGQRDGRCRATATELTPDLWFADYELAVEYEGSQHQEDRRQYNADIDRYAAYRRNDVAYELVTKERLRTPRAGRCGASTPRWSSGVTPVRRRTSGRRGMSLFHAAVPDVGRSHDAVAER